MIDVSKEQPISLTNATKLKLFPERRNGKRPAVTTLWRWATKGCRGVKLETIRIGETLCTSAEALQRFFEGVTIVGDRGQIPPATASRRLREKQRAKEELDAAGCNWS